MAMSPPPAPPAPPEPPSRPRWAHALRVWALLAGIWVVIVLLFAAQLMIFQVTAWQDALAFSAFDWGPWIVLSPLVVWFARRVPIDHRTWKRALPAHIAASIALTVAFDAGFRYALREGWIGFPRPRLIRFAGPGDGPLPPPPPLPAIGVGRPEDVTRVWRGARPLTPVDTTERPVVSAIRLVRARFVIPIYCVIVAATHAIAYHRRSLERERQAGLAEAQLQEARLLALQMQLHPHFLFNTLNTITGFVEERPRVAEEMLCALSELLRGVLALANRREHPLVEELHLIDRYLDIQQLRFTDRLRIRREVGEGLALAAVPPLLLQPLVENAILHGVTPHRSGGRITVTIARDGGRLRMVVSDDGGGRPEATPATGTAAGTRHGLGLVNTRARLSTLYGDDGRLEVSRPAEGGFRTEVNIPLRFMSPEACVP